jgi:hypothetical protein
MEVDWSIPDRLITFSTCTTVDDSLAIHHHRTSQVRRAWRTTVVALVNTKSRFKDVPSLCFDAAPISLPGYFPPSCSFFHATRSTPPLMPHYAGGESSSQSSTTGAHGDDTRKRRAAPGSDDRGVTSDTANGSGRARPIINRRSRSGCLTCRRRRVSVDPAEMKLTARSNATNLDLYAMVAGGGQNYVNGQFQSRNRHIIRIRGPSPAAKDAEPERYSLSYR